MREFIEIYTHNQDKIEQFIEESIESLQSLNHEAKNDYKKLFHTFPSLELIYTIDNQTKMQTSDNIYRHKRCLTAKGKNRSYLIDKLNIKENSFAFTKPYQSSATHTLCITVSKKEGDMITFMDFDLEKLFERLGLIEKHLQFSMLVKSFYMLAGFFMMLLSSAAIIYGAYDFFSNCMQGQLTIDAIFKPVIATTLGLAIFDLAKTVLEQEVFFKSYSKDSKLEIKVLSKFLITILIALSIETLMVVFKIAIENYDKMVNALYLMGGISFIIIALSILIHFSSKHE